MTTIDTRHRGSLGRSDGLARLNRARRRREARVGWAFVAPFAAVFALCFVLPIVLSVKASFYRPMPRGGGLYGGGGLVDTFVGGENFAQVLGNGQLWSGLGRVLLFGAFQIPVMIGGALALALLLDSLLVRRVALYRLGYFLPFAIPGVVAALVWTYMYSPHLSPINQGLGVFGLHLDFFTPGTILGSMANMTTWTFTGYNMLIFLAALQAIPGDLYEAARLDGASEWTIVRRIKVPLVARASTLAVLLSIIGTIQLFNEPTVLAAVNPWMGKAYTPMMMAYNSMTGGVSPSGSGPASAISIVMAGGAGLLAAVYAVLTGRSAQ
ncbi:carbohydrate ABC transporter permease [Nostocoides sp. HKS02]|uniref:carbohydrate ABC transporter permease n=1 Tax=Nostocoides sp. HKS02 TaxID=1813880 RepID=UPI0012B501B6|nr:sugar ABC transporter permease [Tetrasphaera sp. HKS02]QGN59096.1 ABC transporter permease subunit [Tetrasphaera sp. HKS02]